MEYYSYGRDALSARRAEPHRLIFATGNWYMSAWDHASGEQRLFRLDRIKSLELTTDAFTGPEGLEGGAGFEAGDGMTVRLRLDPLLSAWAEEQAAFDAVESLPDGSVLCTLRVNDPGWLERELLRLGPRVEVLEPAGLRAALRARIGDILLLYRDGEE
jgi:proteasome accessory factor C